MSRPRYKWWSYVKWMIRLYPERVAELRRRQEAAVTPRYDAMPGGSEASRTTEELGTASLGRTVDREVEAVRRAIEETENMKTGDLRLRIIDLVYWKQSHTLQGACDAVYVSYDTGKTYQGDFIRCVARYFDLL